MEANVSVVYAKESEKSYVTVFEKFLNRDLTYVYLSNEAYQEALENQTGVLFLHLSQFSDELHNFEKEYELHPDDKHYSAYGKGLLRNGQLVVDSYLLGDVDDKYLDDYKALISQFMQLKNRIKLNLDYTHSCKTIIGASPIPVHEALFYELDQNPETCE